MLRRHTWLIATPGNIAQDIQSFLQVLEERELEISVGGRRAWLDVTYHFLSEAPGVIVATVSSVFGSFWGKADEKGKEDE